ncbi:DUF721 domain-containing protein [Candidatus Peregrinibacteria bacterium]|nr:DUF721 domain-containing protein [Candidatus Peregrinibacteria bacterium]
MFQPFQKFLPRAATRYGISKEMEAAKICRDFRKLTPEIFKGRPQAEDYIQPASYKNKTLTLNVLSPAWAQEVVMRRPKIIEEMNKKAGREIIKNLRTQLQS